MVAAALHLLDSLLGFDGESTRVIGVRDGVREHQHICIEVATHLRNLIAKLIASFAFLVVQAVRSCQFGLQILGVLPQFPFTHLGGHSAVSRVANLVLKVGDLCGCGVALILQPVAFALNTLRSASASVASAIADSSSTSTALTLPAQVTAAASISSFASAFSSWRS